ncbi:MAG: c-type cytochrome [Caldilineaceae bacterium]|nr:c-type cytochrome [Caldilineaceae bacterium]
MTSCVWLPAKASDSAWPGPSPLGKWTRLAAYCLAAVVLGVASFQFTLDWRRIGDMQAVPLHIRAEMPEEGGWQADMLRVPSGRTVELTVHGVSGAHTFALAYTDVKSSRLLGRGDEETVSFVAPAPGRYVLHCTTWCSPNHWRMRTILEVYDPNDEEAPLSYPQLPVRYPIAVDSHGLEMPHLAALWPETKPDAATGADLSVRYTFDMSTEELLAELGWPNVTPAASYQALRRGEFMEGVPDEATDAEIWGLVAYLQQQASTPQQLKQGRALYQQNCVACHGEQGRGDGFAAPLSISDEPDFTDLRAAAGASPALYYAKIARGGMGTGMPNWGTILTEDELWALVDYLQTFAYVPTVEEK